MLPVCRLTAVAVLLLGYSAVLEAQAVAPEEPWFPYPQLRSVLWYDDFDGPSFLGSSGKIAETPDKPGSNSYLLGEIRFTNLTKVCSTANLNFGTTRVKVPNGNNPSQVLFCFNAWAEEDGDLQLQVATPRGNVPIRAGRLVAKKWTPVSVRLSEVRGLEAKDVIRNIQIIFIPSVGPDYRKVYMDEVMVLNGVKKAEDVLPLINALNQRLREATRTQDKNGFAFWPQKLDSLQQAVKGTRRKRSSVLVFPPRPEDGASWVEALKKGASKAKLYNYAFLPAEAPGGPAGGMADARTLLPYNLEKHQAEFVVIAFSYGDMQSPGSSPEVVRVAMERALGVGCLPIFVIPPLLPSAPRRADLEKFVKEVSDIAATKGAIVVEASSVLDKTGPLLDKGELSPQGLEASANVVLDAIKCLSVHVLGRR